MLPWVDSSMLSFITGDILQSTEAYIAQGVAMGNQEGLGTGLAFKISERWPDVQIAFKRYVRSHKFKGGDLWIYKPSEKRPGFFYLATQPDMYHATLPFVRRSLKKLTRYTSDNTIQSVALPKIASGLGKLSWEEEIRPLFVQLLTPGDCRFVVYERYTHEEK